MALQRTPLRSTVLSVAAVALMTIMFVAIGGADTIGTPDTNTRATLDPDAPPAPSPIATTGTAAPGTFTGVVGGQVLHVHVDGAPGKFNGVSFARLCRSGLNVTTASQLSPTFFGNCIANPLPGPANDAVVSGLNSDANKQFVDFDFRIGSGTETSHVGPGDPITCDATSPCALWIQESVDTSVASTGFLFKHFDIQYFGVVTTTTSTTTTQPTTTTTSTTTTQPTTTTTSTTTTQPTTTTTSTTTTQPTTTTTSTTTTQPTTTTSSTTTTQPITTTTQPITTTTQAQTTTTQPPDDGHGKSDEEHGPAISRDQVTPGGTLALSSPGWLPGSTASIVLHSDPVHLADAVADSTGTINVLLTIPASTHLGAHNIDVTGTAADGTARTVTVGVTVRADGSSHPLPRAGAETLRFWFTGTSAVGAGALLVIAAKRRRASVGR